MPIVTCSRRVTRTGLATMRNRCGCECVTVETPDDAYCVGFALGDYDFQLIASNGEYTGDGTAYMQDGLVAAIVCVNRRLRLTISTLEAVVLVQYDAPATGCCVPAVFPQTFTRVGDDEGYPATLDLTACEVACENPLASDETCEDPVPCAYRIINLCPQFKDIDVDCEFDGLTYGLKAWLLDTVTLRRRCSNGDSSVYVALAPQNTYLGTSNFGNGGSSLALNAIGVDWRDLSSAYVSGACVPCSWFDGPTFGTTVGLPFWTNCNGGGGAAVQHRYADDLLGAFYSPLTAFSLDTVAGTLTPNADFFAGVTSGSPQPGIEATWAFPRFPSYSLPDGVEWNCRGCNRLKKDESLYPDEPDEWKMPTYIEIVPIFEPADMPCLTSEAIDEPHGGYDSKQHRSDCCDGTCQCLDGVINLTCGGSSFSCSGQFCTGGHVGQEGPVGPSREMCCDFTIDGVLRHICLVAYCDGTDWKIDVYCDGAYESTVTARRIGCCPLTIDFNFELACAGCVGCGALNTTCEPPEPVGPCCGGAVSEGGAVPDTLHATITDISTAYPPIDACHCGDGTVVAMTYDGGLGYWTGSAAWGSCGRTITISIRCIDDAWTMRTQIGCDIAPYDSGWLSTGAVVCEPFSTYSAPSEISLANCCVPDSFYTVTNLQVDVTA